MARHEGQPCFLYGQALKSFADNGNEIEYEVGPQNDVQDDAGTAHRVEGSEVEEQDGSFGEEDGGVVDYLHDIIELFLASISAR